MSSSFPRRLAVEQIQELIPHRPPFLWLDEAELVSATEIRAWKKVNPELDVFRGHYPGKPILPGVLQCEAVFQAGALLIAATAPPAAGLVPVVTRLNQVQFRQMVGPGETLELYAELTETLANAFFLKGKVLVSGKTAVRLEFACAAAEPDLTPHPISNSENHRCTDC